MPENSTDQGRQDPEGMSIEELNETIDERYPRSPSDDDLDYRGWPEGEADEHTVDISDLVEDHPLVETMPCAAARVLVYLQIVEYDVSASEIIDGAGISQSTWYHGIEETLTEHNLIQVTRVAGQTKMYDLAMSDAADGLRKLADSLAAHS